jgi:hypothetical protein
LGLTVWVTVGYFIAAPSARVASCPVDSGVRSFATFERPVDGPEAHRRAGFVDGMNCIAEFRRDPVSVQFSNFAHV